VIGRTSAKCHKWTLDQKLSRPDRSEASSYLILMELSVSGVMKKYRNGLSPSFRFNRAARETQDRV